MPTHTKIRTAINGTIRIKLKDVDLVHPSLGIQYVNEIIASFLSEETVPFSFVDAGINWDLEDQNFKYPEVTEAEIKHAGTLPVPHARMLFETRVDMPAGMPEIHCIWLIRSPQELLAHLERHAPTALSAARKRMAAYQETGYYDQHAWRLANWGVKWGPASTLILAQMAELLEFRFETPWSFPEAAFRRLGQLYPDHCFDITATNMDHGIGVQGHVHGSEVSLEPMSAADFYDYADASRFDETHEEAATTRSIRTLPSRIRI